MIDAKFGQLVVGTVFNDPVIGSIFEKTTDKRAVCIEQLSPFLGEVMDFDSADDVHVVVYPRDEASTPLSRKLREVLCANMFDGKDGGQVTMLTNVLLDDASQILAEHLAPVECALRSLIDMAADAIAQDEMDGCKRADLACIADARGALAKLK